MRRIEDVAWEADEIAAMLQLTGPDGDQLHQEWWPQDELGRVFVVDLPMSRQAFRVTVEPCDYTPGDQT